MSIYYEWHDIVVYPLDPSRVNSEKERLDISSAVDLSGKSYSTDLADDIEKYGAIVHQADALYDDKEFEVMEIDDYGHVTIWTKSKVAVLLRDRGLEKFLYVRRHPPLPQSDTER